MAKSLRAKAKMANRKKQRERGNYHAADAARVARISARLLGKGEKKEAEDDEGDEEMVEEVEDDGKMETDETASKKVSTSGPRESRRELWRESKGLTARPKRQGQNRQGGIKGRRNSGKPKRRR